MEENRFVFVVFVLLIDRFSMFTVRISHKVLSPLLIYSPFTPVDVKVHSEKQSL